MDTSSGELVAIPENSSTWTAVLTPEASVAVTDVIDGELAEYQSSPSELWPDTLHVPTLVQDLPVLSLTDVMWFVWSSLA